jgi:ferrochelatase
MQTQKRGVLLINIGTPSDLTVKSVRRYLRQFLSDPRVLTMPSVVRFFLVNFVIVPFRAPKSLEAYRAVWTKDGSPLMALSQKLQAKVQSIFQSDVVRIAMRYEEPSIEQVMVDMREQGVTEIIAIPLFPQFSEAATGSAIAEVNRTYKTIFGPSSSVQMKVTPDFYDQSQFIEAQVERIRSEMTSFKSDHILMSYHGLPESHVQATDLSKEHCLKSNTCCAAIVKANSQCYRAQSYATSRAIAKSLGVGDDFYTVSFQSRLGRTPWIRPFTDEIIHELIARGVRRLLVVCPSFVVDCLETLEEIAIRCREDWTSAGGEDFRFVPCVNDSDKFMESVKDLVSKARLLG